MGSIAPISNKRFLGELSRRSRAEISAFYGCNLCCFEIGSVFTAGADLKSTLTYRVVMVILSISAVILVKWYKFREEQVVGIDRVMRSIGTDIKHLSVKSIVELEFDGRVSIKQIAR